MVGPVGTVVGMGGMRLVLLGRHQEGGHPHQLQLLPRDVLGADEELLWFLGRVWGVC